MKLPIYGRELFPQNMVRVKGGGVLKYVGGLMNVVFGKVFMKGGRTFLSICLSQWVKILISVSSMIGGLVIIPLNFSILSSTFVQLTRKLVFLRFCGFRREYY